MKNVNIALKDDVHTKIKLISVLKNVKMRDYLEEAVEKALEHDKEILKKVKF